MSDDNGDAVDAAVEAIKAARPKMTAPEGVVGRTLPMTGIEEAAVRAAVERYGRKQAHIALGWVQRNIALDSEDDAILLREHRDMLERQRGGAG